MTHLFNRPHRMQARLGVERGGDARVWLAELSAYDVWQVVQRFKNAPLHVQPAPAVPDGAHA